MDLITRLVRRTLAQMPVAQPLIAPRFAAGPALAAATAPDVMPAVETEAGGSEPPPVSPPQDASALSLETATRPPLAATVTPQRAEPVSSEPPGPVERPGAEGEQQPSLLPPALQPEVAAPERPAPAAQRAAPGHAEAGLVPVPADRLVQGQPDRPSPGRVGSLILRPGQPDHPPAEEPQPGTAPAAVGQERQPGMPLELVAREQRAGSGPEPVRLRQVSRETVEPGGTVHTLVPGPAAVGGPQKAMALLDARPEVTVGLAAVRPTMPGREATTPDAAPQPPTIHVTIGRVEVQAVMSPKPSPAYAPPARREPALSLKDYLKQRDEGQR